MELNALTSGGQILPFWLTNSFDGFPASRNSLSELPTISSRQLYRRLAERKFLSIVYCPKLIGAIR